MKAVIALTIVAAWAQVLSSFGGASRVVFVRGSEVYTADGEGSNLRQLTSDGKPKRIPKWNVDGNQIAYLTPGEMTSNPKSLAKVEIITAEGKHLATVPILVTMPDGTEVAGMRAVESIGWSDAEHVFAEGSFNPYAGEFRTIDITTGKMGGFSEGGYATCPSKGRVAFWAPTFPPDKSMRLQVNAEDTNRFVFSNWNRLPTIHIPLLWTQACQNVAFVDPQPPAALVLIGAEHGKRRVPLPNWGFEAAQLALINLSLLMRGTSKALVYDLQNGNLTEAPQPFLKDLDSQRRERERVVRELKGETPDWWPLPNASVIPGEP